jgi:hypothetical protein
MKLEEEMNTMCQKIRDNVLKHERKVVPSGDPKTGRTNMSTSFHFVNLTKLFNFLAFFSVPFETLKTFTETESGKRKKHRA